MPRRELRATMKLQSETETQRNILKGEMNMLFYSEGSTYGSCVLLGFGSVVCFNIGFSAQPQKMPTLIAGSAR